MEGSTVVIKVKYGDILRRFNAKVVDAELDLRMGGLTEKIFSLFSFAPDTEILLTYIDEDGDSVALVDDDDIRDAVKQALNPLRIDVKKLNAEKGTPFSLATGTSTPSRSPRVKNLFQNPSTGVSEILKTIPDPLRETIMNLSTDLVSKVSSTTPSISPGVTELVNYFSKVGLSYLEQLAELQPSDTPESSSAVPETKDSDTAQIHTTIEVPGGGKSEKQSSKSDKIPARLKLVPPAKNVEVKAQTLTGGTMGASSSEAPGVNSVAGDVNSNTVEVDQPEISASANPKGRIVHLNVGKKEKAKMINDCNLNGKPHLTFSHPPHVAKPYFIGASDPFKENSLDWKARYVCPSGFENTQETLLPPIAGSFKYPTSSLTYECPFSGISAENVSAAPPISTSSQAVSFNRSKSHNDGYGTVFHRGVRCDGCGVHPITGPRFKSKVKVDYDLCSICFDAMGNDNDYFRIDYPTLTRRQGPFKGFHDHHVRGRCPALPQIYKGLKVKPGVSKLDSRFIQDVNVLDGTAIPPSTPFTKIWRMRNNGTAVWPQKTQLVWIGGDKLSSFVSVEVEVPATGLAVDKELDVAVDFTSPDLPGRYISYWRMASSSGQTFGQRVWVLIQVDATLKETPRVGVQDLNLNLPPVNSVINGPEIITADFRPLVEDSHLEPDNSNKMVEIVDPVLMPLSDNEQETKFPITDSLLVGNGDSSSAPPAPSSDSYPMIDLRDMPPPFSSPAPSVLYPMPTVLYPPPPPAGNTETFYPPPPTVGKIEAYTEELAGKEEVENKLLKELEEMGFKQVDLNKEVLRLNEYDLGQAVDDLCGVAEWDPMLDELQEMGFHNVEMNKKLLKKNNGSIKRVVMDLIAGEEQ